MRRAYDLLAEGFGPGSNGPFVITVEGDAATDPEALEEFVGTLNGTEGVAFATAAQEDVDDLAVVSIRRRPRKTPRRTTSSTSYETT